ncbi:MAG: sulfite exporter TauE/SafE family protein [Parachlamydiales bacterium]|nr:sulfite exporter TauE/SafE family protein [Parachlamydiales bacterium]
MNQEIIFYVLLGIFAGLIAGMLGIGGGVFIVPGLTMIFTYVGFEKDLAIKYAIATSLSIMIFTAFSSAIAHYKRNNIDFDVFKKIFVFIVLGTILGSLIAHLINEKYLRLFFAIFIFLVALQMLFNFKITRHKKSLNFKIISIGGFVIGLKSGLLGIGGGSISVPFLSYFNLPMKKAIGTSTLFTLIISIVGTMSYWIFGETSKTNIGTLGYIYLPALILIAPTTFIFAYIGAKLSKITPNKVLKIIFGFLLIVLSFKMLFYDVF